MTLYNRVLAGLTLLALGALPAALEAGPAAALDLDRRIKPLLQVAALSDVQVKMWDKAGKLPCSTEFASFPCVDPASRTIIVPAVFLERFGEPGFVEAAVAHELAHLRLGHRLPETPEATREADLDGVFLMVRAGLDAERFPSFLDAAARRSAGLSDAKKKALRARMTAVRAVLASLPGWRDRFNVARDAFVLGRYDSAIKLLEALDTVLPDSHELCTNLGLAYLGRYFEHGLGQPVMEAMRLVRQSIGTDHGLRRFTEDEVAALFARGFSLAPDLLGGAGIMGPSEVPKELAKAEGLLTTAQRLGPDEPRALTNLVTVRTELGRWDRSPQTRKDVRVLADGLRMALLSWSDPADKDLGWLTLAAFEYIIGREPSSRPMERRDRALDALSHLRDDGPWGTLARYNRGLLLAFDPVSSDVDRERGVDALRSIAESKGVGPVLAGNSVDLAERAEGSVARLTETVAHVRLYIDLGPDGEHNLSSMGAADSTLRLGKVAHYLSEFASAEMIAEVRDDRGVFLVLDRQALLRWTEQQVLDGKQGVRRLQGPTSGGGAANDLGLSLPPLPPTKPKRLWPIELHFSRLPDKVHPLSPGLPGEGERVIVYVTEGTKQ